MYSSAIMVNSLKEQKTTSKKEVYKSFKLYMIFKNMWLYKLRNYFYNANIAMQIIVCNRDNDLIRDLFITFTIFYSLCVYVD